MKGIVVEINNKDAVILTEEGLFAKVRNESYRIGQTVEGKTARKTVSKLFAAVASAAAAFAICTIGAFAYFTPTDYISMDVNPSVEYSANMFDRVLEAKAANDDGEKILSDLHLNNMSVENAVKATLEELISNGYLADDPYNKVMITTSNKKAGKAEHLASKLQQEIRAYFDSRKDVVAEVEAEAVQPEKVQEAKELGVTAGKLKLVEKLQSSTNEAIDREEWLTMTVKELNKAIKENRKAAKDKANRYDDDDDDDDDWQDQDEWDDADDDDDEKPVKASISGYDMLKLRQTDAGIERQADRKKNPKGYNNQDMEPKDAKPNEDVESDDGDDEDDGEDDDDGRNGKRNDQLEDEESSEEDD